MNFSEKQSIESFKALFINICLIIGVFVFGYICPGLSWHYEVICLINRFPDSILGFSNIFGFGLMMSGVLTLMFWRMHAGLFSIACGFFIIFLSLMFLYFGPHDCFILLAALYMTIYISYMNRKYSIVLIIIFGFLFMYKLDTAPRNEYNSKEKKKQPTHEQLYGDCDQAVWCIENGSKKPQGLYSFPNLFYKTGHTGPYFIGTYSNAKLMQEKIEAEDIKNFGKDENYHYHGITLISVPKEIALKNGDIVMINSLIDRGLINNHKAFLDKK